MARLELVPNNSESTESTPQFVELHPPDRYLEDMKQFLGEAFADSVIRGKEKYLPRRDRLRLVE